MPLTDVQRTQRYRDKKRRERERARMIVDKVLPEICAALPGRIKFNLETTDAGAVLVHLKYADSIKPTMRRVLEPHGLTVDEFNDACLIELSRRLRGGR